MCACEACENVSFPTRHPHIRGRSVGLLPSSHHCSQRLSFTGCCSPPLEKKYAFWPLLPLRNFPLPLLSPFPQPCLCYPPTFSPIHLLPSAPTTSLAFMPPAGDRCKSCQWQAPLKENQEADLNPKFSFLLFTIADIIPL